MSILTLLSARSLLSRTEPPDARGEGEGGMINRRERNQGFKGKRIR